MGLELELVLALLRLAARTLVSLALALTWLIIVVIVIVHALRGQPGLWDTNKEGTWGMVRYPTGYSIGG